MKPNDRLFSNRDFDSLMYSIHEIPRHEKILKKFAALSKIDSFSNYHKQELLPETVLLDLDSVIRYIVYAYDRESPIVKRFLNDVEKRKTTACDYAGFSYDEKGRFSLDVDNMMKCKNRYINVMIIDYVRQYNDPEFALLISGYDAYWQKLVQATTVEEGEEGAKRDAFQIEETKGKIFEQARKMASLLSELSIKILSDENKLLRQDLYSIIDSSVRNRLRITPERLAGLED
jgi:hypothetical protein